MLKRLRNLVSPPAAPARGMSGVSPLLRNDPPAVEQRAALLAGKNISYILKRSHRRRSIGLRIDDRGLTVSMPLRASEEWLHNVLQDKARWVVEKLEGWQPSQPSVARWVDGASVSFLGEPLTLCVRQSLFVAPPILLCESSGVGGGAMRPFPQQRASPHRVMAAPAQQRARELWVFVAHDHGDGHVEQAVAHWYRQEAEHLFAERVAHYAPQLNVAPRTVKLSVAKTQWGCCTARGTVRLNQQLIHLPLRLIDYVVVHELAHLREMNHSAAFWCVVATVCPDYLKLRRELKACRL